MRHSYIVTGWLHVAVHTADLMTAIDVRTFSRELNAAYHALRI